MAESAHILSNLDSCHYRKVISNLICLILKTTGLMTNGKARLKQITVAGGSGIVICIILLPVFNDCNFGALLHDYPLLTLLFLSFCLRLHGPLGVRIRPLENRDDFLVATFWKLRSWRCQFFDSIRISNTSRIHLSWGIRTLERFWRVAI